MERKYMMYEGEEGNSIDPLYEQATDQGNGVKVIVPLKSGDRGAFVDKIKEQLAYFESVYFECDGYIANEYNINRNDHFQYSDLSHDRDMHICLDNVYYPLDFTKLGIDRINIPVGLRFGLKDGLFPTPNREALRYTPEAKQTILAKITLVADYFVEKYNSEICNTNDLDSIFQYYDTKDRLLILENKAYNIATLIPFATMGITIPSYTGMKYINLKTVYKNKASLLNEYTIKYRCRNNKISEVSESLKLKDVDDVHFYLFIDKVSGNKRDYMKSIISSSKNYYFVKKTTSFALGNRDSTSNNNYHVLLQLDKHPRHLWRKIIQEYQTLQQIYISQFKDFDAIQIPKSWLDERKKKRVYSGSGRRTKLHGQIFGKICAPLERFVNGKSSKLISLTLDLESLHRFKGLTVYTSYDEADLLDPLYKITKRAPAKIRYVAFSDREMKLVKTLDVHNLISYNKFMEGDNMPFKRLITAYLIQRLMNDQKHVFDKRDHIKSISTILYEKIELLKNYKHANYNNASDSIFSSMLVVAEQHKLFDPSIYSTYLEIKSLLDKLKFINVVLKQSQDLGYSYRTTAFDSDETHTLLVDMFRYYKQRINLENYNIVSPEPIADPEEENEEEQEEEQELEEELEEVLTDEVLAELQEQV